MNNSVNDNLYYQHSIKKPIQIFLAQFNISINNLTILLVASFKFV